MAWPFCHITHTHMHNNPPKRASRKESSKDRRARKEANEKAIEDVKKYGPYVAGGIALVVIVLVYLSTL